MSSPEMEQAIRELRNAQRLSDLPHILRRAPPPRLLLPGPQPQYEWSIRDTWFTLNNMYLWIQYNDNCPDTIYRLIMNEFKHNLMTTLAEERNHILGVSTHCRRAIPSYFSLFLPPRYNLGVKSSKWVFVIQC